LADDVITKAKISQKWSSAKIFNDASSSKTEKEKLDQTHKEIDVLMEVVCGHSDDEYIALDKMAKKVAKFFEDHKKFRKVHSFLNSVAPKIEGRFCIEIQLGDPKSRILIFFSL
jgi:hypothetical protein